jgi:hypothetical protein
LRLNPTGGARPISFPLQVFAPNNKPIVASGYIYLDPAYNGSAPTVTLSGLGLSNTWTGTLTTGVWQQFLVGLTQTTGADAMLEVTVACTGTTGAMWVDGVSAPTPVAVNSGEFGFWAQGLPAAVVSANFVAAADIWNVQLTDLTLTGSVGERVAALPRLADFNAAPIAVDMVKTNGQDIIGDGTVGDKFRSHLVG